MNKPLKTERDESGVLKLTFDRPEKKNAFNYAMYEELVEALDAAAADPNVRTILLRGRGDAFTSGNDLTEFMSSPPTGEDNVILQFLFRLVDQPKPIVAAVDGAAVGIGTTLLLHCDLVYASPKARFHLPFVNLGLVPEGASSLLLPRLAGSARATELLLFGDPFGAETALDVGMINAVVEDVDAYALERATALADRPLTSLLESKRLLREDDRAEIREVIIREARIFGARLTSPEAMEAFTAFFEKRKPNFRKVESS